MSVSVMGVDACKRGWIGILLEDGAAEALFAQTIEALVSRAGHRGSIAVVAIDIPIGLPDAGLRQADVLARQAVGRRWASVFLTPVRAALAEDDYKRAVLINQERAGGRAILKRPGFTLQWPVWQQVGTLF